MKKTIGYDHFRKQLKVHNDLRPTDDYMYTFRDMYCTQSRSYDIGSFVGILLGVANGIIIGLEIYKYFIQ